MQTHTETSNPIHEMNSLVQALDKTSDQLLYVMEEQIQAIISSSPEKIEELTEKQSSIQSEYKRFEREFISQLQKSLSSPPRNENGPKLGDLKLEYPGEEDQIERWKVTLSQNAKQLKRKNEQLVQLLEFALNRNAKLMHSFYSLFNNKNSHYSPTGEKTSVRSGVAINQEA